LTALRTRVRKSAIGSVVGIESDTPVVDQDQVLPAGLSKARDLTFQGKPSKANAANTKLPIVRPRPSADIAAVVLPDLEFRRSFCLNNHC
jgi:hypothetical protein